MKMRSGTRSLAVYRLIDLLLFALILAILESLIVRAARIWFADQLYTVSLVASVTAIVMMRWGAVGLLHAILGGLVFVAAGGGSAEQFLIYTAGNLFAATGLIMMRIVGKEKITKDGVLTAVYAIVVQVFMQGGRAVIAILCGETARNCLGFFTTDTLSIVFTFLILWIARRQDGLLEDQKSWLKRLDEEKKREEQTAV